MSVRFALLGTGYWAETCHAPGLAAHPDVDFAGVWGRDNRKATRIAERYGTVAEHNLDALLARSDAVAIALPPDVQPELACRAAEAGCHLLLEKPVARSQDDADAVGAAAARAGVATAVFFTLRFIERVALWLGESIATSRWDCASFVMLASSLDGASPFSTSPWRYRRGSLWDAGPHVLSLLIPALGPVEDVAAVEGDRDTVQLALRHMSGAVSSVAVSLTAPSSAECLDFRLWGASGAATLPTLGTPGEPDDLQAIVAPAYQKAVSELLAAINGASPPRCDLAFGLEVVNVLARAECCLG
jgi:predicted dehydrogenase